MHVLRPAAVKALELDPLLADAHAAMGWVHSRERDWADAEHAFQRAIELNPSLTQSYTELFELDVGTARQGRGSVGSSPVRTAKRSVVTRCSARDRGSPITFRAFRRGDRDPAARGRGRSRLSVRGRMAGPRSDVCRQARRGVALTGKQRRPSSGSIQARAVRACAVPRVLVCRTGRRADAEALAVAHKDSPSSLAVIYAALGDKDRTFEALEEVGCRPATSCRAAAEEP